MHARSVLYDHEIVQQSIMHEKVDLRVVVVGYGLRGCGLRVVADPYWGYGSGTVKMVSKKENKTEILR